MALFLIQNEGFCVGASSALNCVAAVKTARKYPQLTNIVTVLCDSGTRYIILKYLDICQSFTLRVIYQNMILYSNLKRIIVEKITTLILSNEFILKLYR